MEHHRSKEGKYKFWDRIQYHDVEEISATATKLCTLYMYLRTFVDISLHASKGHFAKSVVGVSAPHRSVGRQGRKKECRFVTVSTFARCADCLNEGGGPSVVRGWLGSIGRGAWSQEPLSGAGEEGGKEGGGERVRRLQKRVLQKRKRRRSRLYVCA